MKTKEERNALKEEVENANKQRHALTDEELEQVVGGKTVYDARCTVCRNVLGGTGSDVYTYAYKTKLAADFNKNGCPYCGATGENLFEIICAPNIYNLFDGINLTTLTKGVDY